MNNAPTHPRAPPPEGSHRGRALRRPFRADRTRERRVAAFYAEHAAALQRTVARRAYAPEQTIEDACQIAWATLLRRPDVTLDQRGLAWLATVAAREAWRLASRAREIPVGAYLPGDPEPGILPEPPADTTDPADQAAAREQHAQRVQDLARLKPREREALYLKALGHSYQEVPTLSRAAHVASGQASIVSVADMSSEDQRCLPLQGAEEKHRGRRSPSHQLDSE